MVHVLRLVSIAVISGACVDATEGLPPGPAGDAAAPVDAADAAPVDAADAAPRDAADAADAAPRDAEVPDGGADPCACDLESPGRDPVMLFGACTPPLEMGCAARLCDPDRDECGRGYTCRSCAAAACCICAACLPACVFTGPAQGPLPEYLKLGRTVGPAHQAHELAIEGFPFYVGALFYLARLGDSGELPETGGGGECELRVSVPARAPGLEPVWVSQYGGGEPWVLAGFYRLGADPPTCAQPGHPCGSASPCCETADVPMSCQAGRCRRR